jgi:multidrug transporter EmrE-like cation transporter
MRSEHNVIGLNALNPILVCGVIVYGMSFLTWIYVIKNTQVSVAYPLVVGLTTIFTLIYGYFLQHEVVSSVRLVSTALVIIGIIGIVHSQSGK